MMLLAKGLRVIESPARLPSLAQVVSFYLAAGAWLTAPVDLIDEYRRGPGPNAARPLPSSLLKHADEQTVVGLAAACKALGEPAAAHLQLGTWGVVAGPH